MTDYQLIVNFLVALALGLLIGLEREYTQAKGGVRKYGGIRTFPLIALLGALAGFFGERYSIGIAVVTLASVAALIIISHYFFSARKGRPGMTTEVAGLVTFFIGLLSYLGFLLLAVILGVLMTLLLYERIMLHTFVARIKREELHSTIKFAIIAFVVLPVLPDTAFGPFEFFNPRNIWLMVVLVSGISFLGYILVRWLGDRGVEVGGFLGGFVSSTATTLSLVEQSGKVREWKGLAVGIVSANAAMMIKVLALIYILNQEVFTHTIFPIGVMVLGSGVFAAVLSWRMESKKHKIELSSPFTLGPALKFAGIFLVILFAVKVATFYFSQNGVYVATFLAGLFDADATVLSTLQLAQNGFVGVASSAIVLVVVANTLSKVAISFMFGVRKFAVRVIPILVDVALLGVLALVLF